MDEGSITRVVDGAAQTEPGRPDTVPLPEVVGRYRIVSRLGRGGGGVVYAAHDPKLDRTVAVKLLHAGARASEADRARLLREAQALAQISDANVVPVYDVGVDAVTGAVYLVMERVDGEDLRNWLTRPHEVAEILAMFAGAGRGLVAAHAAGVVHRDFKPANVLVGADGRALLGDFGLARVPTSGAPASGSAIESGSIDSGTLTEQGTVMGTPQYMAPEQHHGEVLGPATDQYAFCVALFVALFGRAPFEGRDLAELTAAKSKGVTMPAVPPVGVTPEVIAAIERGLAVDPAQRHRDMRTLVAVLERATQPSRAGRWAIAAIGVGVIAAVAIVAMPRGKRCDGGAGRVAAIWNEASRVATHDAIARGGATYAKTTADRVVERLDERTTAWATSYDATCSATDPSSLDVRMQCLDRELVAIGHAIDVLGSGEGDTARHAARVLDQLPVASDCANDRSADELPSDPELRAKIEIERGRLARAVLLTQAARLDEAIALAQDVAKVGEAIGFRPLVARARVTEAQALGMRGEPAEAVAALERAALLATELGLDDAAAEAYADLASRLGYDLRRPDDAEPALAHAEAADARTGGTALGAARLLDGRATIAIGRGDYARAKELLEQAIAVDEDDPRQGEYLGHLGVVLDITGDHDAAAAMQRRARAANTERFGPEHPMVAYDYGNEGLALRQAGRDDEAQVLFAKELELLERASGPDHPEVAIALSHLVETLDRRKDFEGALAVADRICAIHLKSRGEAHVMYAQALYGRAEVLRELGRMDEAAADLRKSIAIAEAALGSEHADLVMPLRALARVVLGRDDAEARRVIERALAVFEKAPSNPALREDLEAWLAELDAKAR